MVRLIPMQHSVTLSENASFSLFYICDIVLLGYFMNIYVN